MIRYPFKENEPTTDTLTIVVDDGTDPVENATVTIDGDTETTDSTGKVEFDLAYGDYSATVEATGFTTATESIAFRSNHKNFTVSLEATASTGTVTVACEFPQDTPSGYKAVQFYITTEPVRQAPSYPSIVVAMRILSSDYTEPFQVQYIDPVSYQASGYDIPCGSYYIYAESSNTMTYTGEITIDGDEEITITFTN